MINSKTATLIKALETFPEQWALTPVHNKAPKIKNWQHGIDRKTIIEELETGRANGIGLITGELSGCILAIDCDGPTAHQLAEKLGGLPHTVSWTSGKPGRAQYLYKIPELYQEPLKEFTRKILETETKGEQLEIRYNASQSVVPPSRHPETDGYKWINSIENTPIAEVPTWVIEKILDEKPEQPKLDFTQAQNFDPIPLIKCLSREHREWVANGINHGGRNDAGAELARDLIGTESQLQYLGIPYNDSARGLFDDYCDRCNPPINNGERETIWRSAQKDNPTPCLDDDKLENCYKHWQRKQRQPSTNNSKPNYKTSGNTALKPDTQSNVVPINKYQQQPIDIDLIEEELREIAEQNLPKSKEQLKLNELARKCNYNPKEIAEIFKNIKEENEEKESQDDIKSELDDFLNNKYQSLDTSKYLPDNLNKITELTTRLCLRPELGLTIFYTTISSLLKVGTKIDLSDYTNFDQPTGIYSAIVAEPSQRKSPLINAIATNPLRELLKKSKAEYTEEMKQYAMDLKDFEGDKSGSIPEPIKPVMRHYYVNSGTGAGMRDLINEQAKNTWGITLLADEISGWFKSQSQSYNVGQKEDFLSYYDGFGKRDALKGGLASDFEECLVSVLGGIQPNVFKEFNDGSDDNGAHARFNFVNQPTQPFIIPDNPQGSLDLLPLLTGFYEKIAELPQLNLRLSPEAKKHFDGLNNKCELYRVNAKSLALASLWGKMPGKIGRFAALIHIVEQLAKGNSIDPIVGKGTLTKAANLAKFYYREAENLYITCSQGSLTPTLANILEIAKEAPGAIAARDVLRHKLFRTKDFKGVKSADIQQLFIRLADMGHGSTIGSGVKLRFQFCHGLSQVVTSDCDKPKDIQDKDSSHLSQLSQEKNKNFESQPTNMDDSTILVEKSEKQKSAVTVVTKPGNPHTEVISLCHNNLGQVVTSCDKTDGCGERSPEPEPQPGSTELLPDDYRPTLKELTSADPLPPLINLAVLIEFDSLKQGETIFDANGTPHTLKLNPWGYYWDCEDGLRIDKDNIGKFHRE